MALDVKLAIISSATAVILALINLLTAFFKNRKERKNGIKEQLDRIEKISESTNERLTNVEAHNETQYMAILRLTVMDSDMPMSERLIAGKEYLTKGGNGDVKKFYEILESQVNH